MIIDIHDDGHHYTWRSRRNWPEDQHIRIFVESEYDAAIYTRLTGPTLGRWIQFVRAPREDTAIGKSGSNKNPGGLDAWRAMMNVRSQPDGGKLTKGLYRAYCLLDGEESARARSRHILSADDPIIRSGRAIRKDTDHTWHSAISDTEGVLFLNCYELENLYLLYTDALDVVFNHWGESLRFFGEDIPHGEAWKILQRTLLRSKLTQFAHYYNIHHDPFGEYNGKLGGRGDASAPLVESAIRALMNPPASKIDRAYRAPLATIRAAGKDLRKSVAEIQKGTAEITRFDPALLAECDGKAFLKLAMRQRQNWAEYFQSQLFTNGFAAYFQMSLVMALENAWEPRSNDGSWYSPFYGTQPYHRSRTNFTDQPPGYEYSIGRGRYTLTARRRSWRNAPPINPIRAEELHLY